MECPVDKYIMNHLKADLYSCPGCGLVKSGLKPLESIYNGDYAKKYKKYANTNLGKRLNHIRWSFVMEYLNSGLILDFGCGVPVFGQTAGERFEVVNFDVNKELKFNDVSVFKDRYDAVTFWDSLEHLENPLDTLRMLNTNHIFITTPSTTTVKDITDWPHYRPFEHVYYFNDVSLGAMLEKAGFRVLGKQHSEGFMRRSQHAEWLLTVAAEKI